MTTTGGSGRSDISVLGLGNMGAALAGALLAQGRKVAVWNRTVAKSEPLAKAGATVASSAAAAIAASPITVICAIDKAASASILRTSDVAAATKGRAVVDLSTGVATDARAASEWLLSAGATYLDGGILCYPRDVGKADTVILYAGDSGTFREHESTLSILAGAQRYVGAEPGAAATVYLALWSFYFGGLTAFFEGAALAATAGVSIDKFTSMATAIMTPKLADGIDDAARRVVTRDLAGNQAPIDAYLDNLYLVREAFTTARASHLTVDAFIVHLEKTKASGGGGNDVAALFNEIFAATKTQ